ncbi:hypothetical protein BDZ89DRAFT_1061161, partial [Hymenopellis radicata]
DTRRPSTGSRDLTWDQRRLQVLAPFSPPSAELISGRIERPREAIYRLWRLDETKKHETFALRRATPGCERRSTTPSPYV